MQLLQIKPLCVDWIRKECCFPILDLIDYYKFKRNSRCEEDIISKFLFHTAMISTQEVHDRIIYKSKHLLKDFQLN